MDGGEGPPARDDRYMDPDGRVWDTQADVGGDDGEEEGEEEVQDVSDEDEDPPRTQAIPAPPWLPRNPKRVSKPSSVITLLSCTGKEDKELVL